MLKRGDAIEMAKRTIAIFVFLLVLPLSIFLLQKQAEISNKASVLSSTTASLISDADTLFFDGTTWKPSSVAITRGGNVNGANPIWRAPSVTEAEARNGTEVVTFRRTFTAAASTGILSISVDDQFIALLNGQVIASVGNVLPSGELGTTSQATAKGGSIYSVNIKEGENELIIKARGRTGITGDTPQTNPAWVAYNLTYTPAIPTPTQTATQMPSFAPTWVCLGPCVSAEPTGESEPTEIIDVSPTIDPCIEKLIGDAQDEETQQIAGLLGQLLELLKQLFGGQLPGDITNLCDIEPTEVLEPTSIPEPTDEIELPTEEPISIEPTEAIEPTDIIEPTEAPTEIEPSDPCVQGSDNEVAQDDGGLLRMLLGLLKMIFELFLQLVGGTPPPPLPC